MLKWVRHFRKHFGFESLMILSGGYRQFLTISNTKNQWIMSGLLMKNQRQANEIIPMNLTAYSE
jgi:hypothetical protein